MVDTPAGGEAAWPAPAGGLRGFVGEIPIKGCPADAEVLGDIPCGVPVVLHPPRRDALLKLRDELKAIAEEISGRVKISARIAAAVLGHLNTAVRLLAGAVERAGVYTKSGAPKVTRRIGVMEAIA